MVDFKQNKFNIERGIVCFDTYSGEEERSTKIISARRLSLVNYISIALFDMLCWKSSLYLCYEGRKKSTAHLIHGVALYLFT